MGGIPSRPTPGGYRDPGGNVSRPGWNTPGGFVPRYPRGPYGPGGYPPYSPYGSKGNQSYEEWDRERERREQEEYQRRRRREEERRETEEYIRLRREQEQSTVYGPVQPVQYGTMQLVPKEIERVRNTVISLRRLPFASFLKPKTRADVLQQIRVAKRNKWQIELFEWNLRGADLSSLDLSGANLRSAILQRANLRYCNLQFANMRDAYLEGADLSGANLEGASLSGTLLQETVNLFDEDDDYPDYGITANDWDGPYDEW